jgi:hypothetical protein
MPRNGLVLLPSDLEVLRDIYQNKNRTWDETCTPEAGLSNKVYTKKTLLGFLSEECIQTIWKRAV